MNIVINLMQLENVQQMVINVSICKIVQVMEKIHVL